MAPTSELTSLNYTTPTCSLEVVGELSPLSRVAEKPLLKRLRFDLQIRDGAGSSVLEVRGVRSHLLALSNAVQAYVQHYLSSNDEPDRLPPAQPEGILLQPASLTRHTLHLGNLALPKTAQEVRLSTPQLADLADVLDQLDQAVAMLPIEVAARAKRSRRSSQSRRFAWAGTAAAAMLVAVGASTILPSVLNRGIAPQPETASAPQPAPSGGGSAQSPSPSTEASPPTAPVPSTEDAPPPVISANPQVPTGSPTTVLPPGSTVPPDAAAKGAGPGTSMVPQVPLDQTIPSVPPALPEPEGEGSLDGAASQTARSAGGAAQEQAPAALSAPPDTAAATGPAADAAAANFQAGSVDTLRSFIQSQWLPPTDLTESISYTLLIDPAGKLLTVVPQSELAMAYRDRIPLPPIETQVLTAGGPQQNLTLTLFPSGTVTLQ